ncbi:hypothetical protein C0J52_14095 [Blattella germanica]|nr:hypothetical protein C0J52_14095 [Blattella germanica]
MLLLSLIEHRIAKKNTVTWESIPAHIRLALTLKFLASGETYTSLMYSTRIPVTTIEKIVPNVSKVIFECLRDKYLKVNPWFINLKIEIRS